MATAAVSAARIKCELCGRTVKNEFRQKWKHIVRFHPDLFAARLAPLIENPYLAHQLGVDLSRVALAKMFDD